MTNESSGSDTDWSDELEFGGKDVELSPEEVISAFTRENFIKALSIAADRTKERGNETGFFVQLDEEKTPFIDSVREGGPDSMEDADDVADIDERSPWPAIQFLDYHFHPDEPVIEPSSHDVHSMLLDADRVFVGIGILKENMDIVVLLVRGNQERLPHATQRQKLQDYTWARKRQGSQDDINARLNAVGLRTTMVQFERNGNSYQMSDQSKQTITQLGTLPVKLLSG